MIEQFQMEVSLCATTASEIDMYRKGVIPCGHIFYLGDSYWQGNNESTCPRLPKTLEQRAIGCPWNWEFPEPCIKDLNYSYREEPRVHGNHAREDSALTRPLSPELQLAALQGFPSRCLLDICKLLIPCHLLFVFLNWAASIVSAGCL